VYVEIQQWKNVYETKCLKIMAIFLVA